MTHRPPGTTVRDLLRVASRRREPIRSLLAFTIFVETLNALAKDHRRGVVRGGLTPEEILLTGVPPARLLDDPSRDPRVRLADPDPAGLPGLLGSTADATRYFAPEASRAGRPAPAMDLYSAGAVLHTLLSRSESTRCPDERRLLAALLEPRAERRLGLGPALDAGRSLGLERLEAWLATAPRTAPQPREPAVERVLPDLIGDARGRLSEALYAGRAPDVERQERVLRSLLGSDADLDPDLVVARGWLEEASAGERRTKAMRRRVATKLLVTGAPVVLATVLSGLLLAAIVWSG